MGNHPGRPKMTKHVVRPQARTETCQQFYLRDGQLHQCGQPTRGHTYCPDCELERSTAPMGRRYDRYTGPAFGNSRRTGAAA